MNYGSTFGMWDFVVNLFYYAVFCLLPVGTFAVLIHALYSLPMRRRERARFFLDVIETALDRGQSAERAIVSAAEVTTAPWACVFTYSPPILKVACGLEMRWEEFRAFCHHKFQQCSALEKNSEV